MKNLKGHIIAMALGCLLLPTLTPSEASARVLSDEEVRENFEASRKRLMSMDSGTKPTEKKAPKTETQVAKFSPKTSKLDKPSEDVDVMLVPETAKAFHERELTSYKDLGDIRVAVNIENATLEQIMEDIVSQAEQKTGPWDIAWRLKNENRYLLDDKVNITAESNFDEFVGYMVDRVNNMSGVQLFVKVFNMSRVIVISDTYY
ncbi:MAG: hypothetical protein VX730_03570 [Pseudomonadota bacterium]|nr:hypothetical protein [Pseudomonadota bacterium]